ncbi:MAG: endo-1,4-beta-xylanase, partial [Bacteroidota bacterium]
MKLQLISIIILLAMLSACGGDEMPDNGPMLAAPDLPEATEVTTNSFLLDWEIVEGADAYQIDIATDNAFTSFVAPYENLRRSFSELSVENLDEATTYFVRIRAVAQSVTSENSNIVSVTTMSETNETPDDTTLKGKASFAVGMAVQAGRLSGEHERILLAEFDQITSEFEMKMNIMYPSEGNFDFSRADMTVDWAVANDIEVHGHALIWHNATPSWVENFNGTDAEFEAMVEDYIKTVVTRYKGKVRSWDVVNEAFEDQGGVLRNSVFRRKMGDDYIEKCHRWVREADPEVLIFYNDYNMVFDPIKRGAALGLVKDFQDRGVPVDGFGFQM